MYNRIFCCNHPWLSFQKSIFFMASKKEKDLSRSFLTHPTTRNSFEYSSLTGTRTSYTRLFVVTTRTRTEKFLWRNSNGWWLGGGWETDEVDFWMKPIHTRSNMSKKQIESMMMKADLNGDGSVSSYLYVSQSFFQVCWLWRICEDDASIKSKKIC